MREKNVEILEKKVSDKKDPKSRFFVFFLLSYFVSYRYFFPCIFFLSQMSDRVHVMHACVRVVGMAGGVCGVRDVFLGMCGLFFSKCLTQVLGQSLTLCYVVSPRTDHGIR